MQSIFYSRSISSPTHYLINWSANESHLILVNLFNLLIKNILCLDFDTVIYSCKKKHLLLICHKSRPFLYCWVLLLN